jgi:hypothetical protein
MNMGSGNTSLKPEEDWTEVEDTEAHGNSKALNAIFFNDVDKNMFRLINTCTVAKDVSNKLSNIKSQDRDKDEEESDQDREVRCFECECYVHFKVECSNYHKRQRKCMSATLSDSEEEEEERSNKVKAFSGTFETDRFSNDDLIEKELAEAYRWTNTRIEELRLVIERQEETNKELVRDKEEILSIVTTLEEKVTLFNSKLTNMKKL